MENVGYNKTVTAAGIEHLLSAALQVAPGLAEASLSQCWSGLRPDSSDGLQAALDRALEPLNDRERDIIRRYYGLGRTEAMSLAEIGESVNLSRERVRQIRERAFAKIRQGEQARLLAEYLD